jgi:hypothetical protein
MKLTQQEYDLVLVMREIKYGEIYGIELASGIQDKELDVSPSTKALIQAIRDGENDIGVLTVHNKEPVNAEVDYKSKGFCCRKKIKFPTL